VLKIQA